MHADRNVKHETRKVDDFADSNIVLVDVEQYYLYLIWANLFAKRKKKERKDKYKKMNKENELEC